MADAADIAAENIELAEQAALARFRRTGNLERQESRTHCTFCEEPIPEGRRLALPGVTCCIECAD